MNRTYFKIHPVNVLPSWKSRRSTGLALVLAVLVSVWPFLALLAALETIEIKNAEIERISFELLLADAKIYELHEQGCMGRLDHAVEK